MKGTITLQSYFLCPTCPGDPSALINNNLHG